MVQSTCSEKGQLEQVVQDSVLLGFEWRLHNLSGEPIPVFDDPHSRSVVLWFCVWFFLFSF